MPLPKHRRLQFSILAAVLSLLGGMAAVQHQAAASWQAMQVEVEALRQQQPTRDPRPPLWGDAAAGDAFVHYREAITAASGVAQNPDTAMPKLLRREVADLAADVALRSRWRPALTALRAGSHAADAAPPAWREGKLATAIVNLLDCRSLANFAMCEARALLHERQALAAVQHSLDAAQFGADLMHRGLLINQMIATAIVGIATEWPDPSLRELDAPALDALAAGLERLDRRLPVVCDYDAELLWMAAHAQQMPPDPAFVPAASSWRHGFSGRWMLAEGFLFAAEYARNLRQTRELEWPQREAVLELEGNAIAATSNPVVALMVPNLAAAERGLRRAIAEVRLLRMAVDLHRGLDVPPLRDPLGAGPLVVTRSSSGVRIASGADEEERPLVRVVRL
jgi:hypothetical protein